MKKASISKDITEIENLVRKLSLRDRKTLIKGLRKRMLYQEAKQLSQSVDKEMKISIDEILGEINAIRNKHAA